MITALAFVLAASATVQDLDGVDVTVPAKDAKATVLLFIGTDCPISNRLAPEMVRLKKDLAGKPVAIIFVYPDGEAKEAEVRAHMKQFKLTGTAVVDRKHVFVKLAKATVTPEATVFLPDGTIAYHGRINDLYAEHNRPKAEVKRRDLFDAVQEVLAGKPVSKPYQPAVGCYIAVND